MLNELKIQREENVNIIQKSMIEDQKNILKWRENLVKRQLLEFEKL
jgi:hypothetical protein